MPVPSSYNDITQDSSIRDHVGLVWYDRRFFVPDTWRKAEFRVWLRFSSVHYAAQVVNMFLIVLYICALYNLNFFSVLSLFYFSNQ